MVLLGVDSLEPGPAVENGGTDLAFDSAHTDADVPAAADTVAASVVVSGFPVDTLVAEAAVAEGDVVYTVASVYIPPAAVVGTYGLQDFHAVLVHSIHLAWYRNPDIFFLSASVES